MRYEKLVIEIGGAIQTIQDSTAKIHMLLCRAGSRSLRIRRTRSKTKGALATFGCPFLFLVIPSLCQRG
jgi:hypothetical protein